MRYKIAAIIALVFFAVCGVSVSAQAMENDGENAYKIKNIAITVGFSDGDGIVEGSDGVISTAFGEGSDGLKGFTLENSDGKLIVDTEVIAHVVLKYPHTYFLPAYKYSYAKEEYRKVNEDGYDNRYFDDSGNEVESGEGNISVDYAVREQLFIREILNSLSGYELPDGIDGDGDGYIDSITFIPMPPVTFDGDDGSAWGTIFWPHASNFYYGDIERLSYGYYIGDEEGSFSEVSFGGKTPFQYLVAPYAGFYDGKDVSTSVVCHEFMHVIGAPDLYRYDGGDVPVGEYDLLADNTSPPQLSLSYIRQKMGWIDEGEDILAIEESGTYSLAPTEISPDVKAYKIVLSNFGESGDSYYIENRNNGYLRGSGLSASGIIIYRVNESEGYKDKSGEKSSIWTGNMYGTEVYVFRQWEKNGLFSSKYSPRKEIVSGSVNYAAIRPDAWGVYSSYGSESGTRNIITGTDGKNTGISVKAIEMLDDGTVTFEVSIPESADTPNWVNGGDGVYFDEYTRENYLKFSSEGRKGYAYITVSERRIQSAVAERVVLGEYGKTKKIPVSFGKCVLDDDVDGKYVYVCTYDGEKYSDVKEYFMTSGGLPPKLKTLIILSAAGGVFIVVLTVIAIKIFSKKGEKR
ncbi:MAG: hypothetical protein J6N93_00075 [Clostridia bacterium]|nr:hypothetical protein [Clostridia bacterium]